MTDCPWCHISITFTDGDGAERCGRCGREVRQPAEGGEAA